MITDLSMCDQNDMLLDACFDTFCGACQKYLQIEVLPKCTGFAIWDPIEKECFKL